MFQIKNICVFSGLGADERVFRNIHFGNHNVIHISWIPPKPNESIEDYALRLSEKITISKPILLGLSFGGMIAIEVAKYIETEKIILISSSKNKKEIPFYYRLAGKLYLHKLIRASVLVKANKLSNRFFSVRTTEDKQLMASMLKVTDVDFLNWAVDKIVHLKNEVVHKNLIHIHGTADRILPLRFVKADIIIKGGSHLMIMNKARAVQEKILAVLK